ncbi:MAG TPA: DUF1850 domain-containing protein [bacterium]|jgi:hypothetical protein|nr:DUF1850 domain-containing protein [bacterium]
MSRARFLFGAAILMAAGAALWPVPVVTVTAAPPGSGGAAPVARTLLRVPLHAVVEIRLEYTHSVERTRVVETYLAERSGLRLVRMEFASQGAGLPSEGYVREGNRFVLRTDRPLASLPVRVSGIGRQRLFVGGAVLELLAAAGEGGIVTVAVGTAPRLPLLRGMLY